MTAMKEPIPNRSRVSAIAWGTGVLALCVTILIATTSITRSCTADADKVAGSMKGWFKVDVVETTVLQGTVDTVTKRAKLIVQQADITAEVYKSEQYKAWGIYFGTTVASVRANKCKVQYSIDLEGFSLAKNIEKVETADHQKILRILLPEPKVDEDIVEVDYTQLEVQSASAWARFNKGDVADDAKKFLRQQAIEAAKRPQYIHEAEATAATVASELFQPLAGALQPDVKLEIRVGQTTMPASAARK